MSISKQNFDEIKKAKFFQIVNIILFFLQKSGISEISQMYLHKVLWYADFIAYRDWNKSISGFNYQANYHGPTNKFLSISNFPINKQSGNIKYYSYKKNLSNDNLLNFNEKALLAEICVILAPFLKNRHQQQFFYKFIHELEPAYKNTWDMNPKGDIDYEKSKTIQIDKTYREEALIEN
jgi:hypothetical protein